MGKITYSYGGEPTAAHATINGDPMITGFDGRAFEFMGEPGKFYSLLSEQRHQVRRTCRSACAIMAGQEAAFDDSRTDPARYE